MKKNDLMKKMIIIKDCNIDRKEMAAELIAREISRRYNRQFLKKIDIPGMSEKKQYQSAFLEDGVYLMAFRAARIEELVIGICIPDEPVMIDGKDAHFIALLITSPEHAREYTKAVYAINMIAQENNRLKLLQGMKEKEMILNRLIMEAFAYGWE